MAAHWYMASRRHGLSEWVQDRFGVYIAFAIGKTTQRLRWIPPGRVLDGLAGGRRGAFRLGRTRHEEVTVMRVRLV